MREYNMIHDWSQNHVYLTVEDKTLRVDLKIGKVHSMAHKFFKENFDTTIVSDSKPTTSINYCKNLQKDIDPRTHEYTNDELQIHDLDWSHLLATMDVWGKRGITCVDAQGTPLPSYVPLCTISVVSAKDTCDTKLQDGKLMHPRARQNDTNQNFTEPFHIGLDLHTLKTTIIEPAIIDSGADLNILSYEV